ncbi:hypothetical protein LOC59_03055 [Arthrobacter sp. zg-Y916]|uniref:hypothetical protein n=1 Tax=Arthrobacter sp. zg-Y916 TaxID=2894190 RepID=UPI001E44589D|nr:hypothetical protein [Arthrobacter sp. zg-Y916]MCC9192633.1 hypothetical protein [Arthrobacter sp. zg-Y916]
MPLPPVTVPRPEVPQAEAQRPLQPEAAGTPRPWGNAPAAAGAVRPPAHPPQPVKSEAELAREKRRRDLRNINITLYAGSLLLVAAASLFIGISIPEQARFAGVVALTVLFYAAGLVVHSRRKALRPAAVAFTGTGLALIPVVGLALYNFLLPDAALAWLVTSVVGSAAFAYAAARLESRVVTYLALTFLISTALASGASLRAGIVWAFLFTVLLATLISLAAFRRPAWLRNIYLDAFVQAHRYLVPATAAAAVLVWAELGTAAIAALFLAFGAYYLVMFRQAPRSQALAHSLGARVSATVGLTALADTVLDSLAATLLAAVFLLGVQAAALCAGTGRYLAVAALSLAPAQATPKEEPRSAGLSETAPGAVRVFHTDLLAVLALQFAAATAAAVAYAVEAHEGSGNLWLFVASAVLAQLTLFTAAWKLRNAAEPLASAALLLPVLACLLTSEAPLWPVLLLLVTLTGYFVLRAVRAQAGTRAAFTLAARTAALPAVPLAVFILLQSSAPGSAWTWTLAAAFLAAALNQAWSVLLGVTGRPENYPQTVHGLSAAAALAFAAALAVEAPAEGLMLAVIWVTVLLNTASSLLLERTGRALAALYAPAGFLAGALLGAGQLGLRGYEVLAAAAVVYSAVQALWAAPRPLRGYYLAAGQALVSVLAALMAADLRLTVHGVFVTVAVSLALQHLARTLLGKRLDFFGMAQVLTWGSLLALAAVAPAYYLLLASQAQAETGSVLLLIAGASAVMTQVAASLLPKTDPAWNRAPVAAAALVLLLCAGVRAAESPAGPWAAAALWVALAANLATAARHRHTLLALLAPGGFLAAGAVGAGVLGLRGYEFLCAAALAYCVVMVLDRAGGFRGAYLAAAQALAPLLAALIAADAAADSRGAFFAVMSIGVAAGHLLRTLFHSRVRDLGLAEPVRWSGLAVQTVLPFTYLLSGRTEPVTLLIMILAAAAVFLLTQLDAAVRIRNGRALPYCAELVIAAAAGALLAVPAIRLAGEQEAVWGVAVLWTALGINAASSLLLRPGRWEALAVAGFAGAGITGAGLLGLRGYELLVLAALGYSSYLAARKGHPNRGRYLLAVQLLTAVLAVLVAADAGANIHGLFASGAAAVATAQILRTVLEPRLAGVGLSAAALWTSLALLSMAPVGYAALLADRMQRDVVSAFLLLLLVVSVSGFLRCRRAVVLYPAAAALGALPLALTELVPFSGGGVLPEAPLSIMAAGLVLAAFAAAALAGEARPALPLPVRTVLLASAGGFILLTGLAAAADESLALGGLAAAAAAAGLLTASYTRNTPWLSAGTAALVFASALLCAGEFERTVLRAPFAPGYGELWPAWGAALALQAARLIMSLAEQVPGTVLRLRIMGSGSSWLLVLGAVPAMAEFNSSAAAGSLTLLAALALAVREVPGGLREAATEAAVLPAALAVQRLIWFVLGPADLFWSLQYWAAVLAGVAAWEFIRRRGTRGTAVLGAAAVIVSGSGLGTVSSGDAGEQLWALLAHAALLAFGLLASRKLFTIWGAAGVALAVLWYLRGYTFLLLALLAAGLIGLAVWRLTRVRADPEESREKEDSRA